MKVTLVNAEWLPVPPVLGGAVEQTLFETATGIRDPELTAISAWSEKLGHGPDYDPAIFYHVHIREEAERAKEILGDHLPPELKEYNDNKTAKQFYYLRGTKALLSELNPDVIQVHNRPELVPGLADAFPTKQMVLYMHNEPYTYVKAYLGDTVKRVDHLVFVSQFLADRFVARYPEVQNRTAVIHNSVDIDQWDPGLRDSPEAEEVRQTYGLIPGRTVLFVGRTVQAKGISFLLKAMEIVQQGMPDVKLLVVGSPFFGAVSSSPFLKKLKDQASRLGDTVVFTGFVERHRIPYYYAAADIAVVPSLWQEPFGKVVTEAIAAGVPIIASRRGGIPEIFEDGKEGLLIDLPPKPAYHMEKTAALLAGRIIDLLKTPEMRKRMGRAGRLRAERYFSTSVRLERLDAFYRSIR